MPKKELHGLSSSHSHSNSRSVTRDSYSKSRSRSRSFFTRSEGSNSRSRSNKSRSVSHSRSRSRSRSKSPRSYTRSRSHRRSKNRSRKRSRSQNGIQRPRRLKNKLYVGGLKPHVTRDHLYESFECYGAIKEVAIGRPGYGFVEFKKERDAECALDNLDGKYMQGSKIHIEFAKAISNTTAGTKKKVSRKIPVTSTSGPKRSITPLMSRKLKPTLLASSLITSDGTIQPLLPIFKRSSLSPRDNISPRRSKISPIHGREPSKGNCEPAKHRRNSPRETIETPRRRNKSSRLICESPIHEIAVSRCGRDSPRHIKDVSRRDRESSRHGESLRNGRDIGRLSPQTCRRTSRLSPHPHERSLSPRYAQRLSPPPKLTRESPIRHRLKRSVSPLPPPDVFVAKRERAMKLLPAPPSFRDLGEERFYEEESKMLRGRNRSLHLARPPPVREISPHYHHYSPAHYPFSQPSQFNNQMHSRRSISNERYINRSISRERYIQRSMSNHKYVRRSISRDLYTRRSRSRERYVRRSISSNRFIFKSKSKNRYVNRSISRDMKYDRSISRNKYINRSISNDRNKSRSISKDRFLHRSISHSMRLEVCLDQLREKSTSPYIKTRSGFKKAASNHRSRSMSRYRIISRSISMHRSKSPSKKKVINKKVWHMRRQNSRDPSKDNYNRHIKPPTPPSPHSYSRSRRSLLSYERNRNSSYKQSISKVLRPNSNADRSGNRITKSFSNRNSMSRSPSIKVEKKFLKSPRHVLRKKSASNTGSENQIRNVRDAISFSPTCMPIKQHTKSHSSLNKYRSPSLKYKSQSPKYRSPLKKNKSPSLKYRSPSANYTSRLTVTRYISPQSYKASVNKYSSISPPVNYKSKSRSIYKSPSKQSRSRSIYKSPAKRSRSQSNYRSSTKKVKKVCHTTGFSRSKEK